MRRHVAVGQQVGYGLTSPWASGLLIKYAAVAYGIDAPNVFAMMMTSLSFIAAIVFLVFKFVKGTKDHRFMFRGPYFLIMCLLGAASTVLALFALLRLPLSVFLVVSEFESLIAAISGRIAKLRRGSLWHVFPTFGLLVAVALCVVSLTPSSTFVDWLVESPTSLQWQGVLMLLGARLASTFRSTLACRLTNDRRTFVAEVAQQPLDPSPLRNSNINATNPRLARVGSLAARSLARTGSAWTVSSSGLNAEDRSVGTAERSRRNLGTASSAPSASVQQANVVAAIAREDTLGVDLRDEMDHAPVVYTARMEELLLSGMYASSNVSSSVKSTVELKLLGESLLALPLAIGLAVGLDELSPAFAALGNSWPSIVIIAILPWMDLFYPLFNVFALYNTSVKSHCARHIAGMIVTYAVSAVWLGDTVSVSRALAVGLALLCYSVHMFIFMRDHRHERQRGLLAQATAVGAPIRITDEDAKQLLLHGYELDEGPFRKVVLSHIVEARANEKRKADTPPPEGAPNADELPGVVPRIRKPVPRDEAKLDLNKLVRDIHIKSPDVSRAFGFVPAKLARPRIDPKTNYIPPAERRRKEELKAMEDARYAKLLSATDDIGDVIADANIQNQHRTDGIRVLAVGADGHVRRLGRPSLSRWDAPQPDQSVFGSSDAQPELDYPVTPPFSGRGLAPAGESLVFSKYMQEELENSRADANVVLPRPPTPDEALDYTGEVDWQAAAAEIAREREEQARVSKNNPATHRTPRGDVTARTLLSNNGTVLAGQRSPRISTVLTGTRPSGGPLSGGSTARTSTHELTEAEKQVEMDRAWYGMVAESSEESDGDEVNHKYAESPRTSGQGTVGKPSEKPSTANTYATVGINPARSSEPASAILGAPRVAVMADGPRPPLPNMEPPPGMRRNRTLERLVDGPRPNAKAPTQPPSKGPTPRATPRGPMTNSGPHLAVPSPPLSGLDASMSDPALNLGPALIVTSPSSTLIPVLPGRAVQLPPSNGDDSDEELLVVRPTRAAPGILEETDVDVQDSGFLQNERRRGARV